MSSRVYVLVFLARGVSFVSSPGRCYHSIASVSGLFRVGYALNRCLSAAATTLHLFRSSLDPQFGLLGRSVLPRDPVTHLDIGRLAACPDFILSMRFAACSVRFTLRGRTQAFDSPPWFYARHLPSMTRISCSSISVVGR